MKWIGVFFVLLATACLGQVSGVILDQGNRKPVQGNTVFVDRTTLSVTTNSSGEFSINGFFPGSWILVSVDANHILRRTAITLDSTLRKRVDLDVGKKKQPSKNKFRPDEAWNKNFEWFERALLGTGVNAANCVFKDTHEVTFDGTADHLNVLCPAPLIIDNRGLGYRITYYLVNFEAGIEQTRTEGFLFFDTLAATSAGLRRGWEHARSEAYKGSVRHFLRSAITHSVAENGFEMWDAVGRPLPIDSMRFKKSGEVYTLSLTGRITVRYSLKQGTSGIQQADEGGQTSWLTQVGQIQLLSNGVVLDPHALLIQGQMAIPKLGDELPYNYVPPDDDEKVGERK